MSPQLIQITINPRRDGSDNTREVDDTVWHPGDTITGTVTFSNHEQMHVRDIKVELEGRISTKMIIGNYSYSGQVVLFKFIIPLFQGTFTLLPTTKSLAVRVPNS